MNEKRCVRERSVSNLRYHPVNSLRSVRKTKIVRELPNKKLKVTDRCVTQTYRVIRNADVKPLLSIISSRYLRGRCPGQIYRHSWSLNNIPLQSVTTTRNQCLLLTENDNVTLSTSVPEQWVRINRNKGNTRTSWLGSGCEQNKILVVRTGT
jgi:hypothetical protein